VQYTGTFVPPTTALSSVGAVLLWHFDDYPVTKIKTVHVGAVTPPALPVDVSSVFADPVGGHTGHIYTTNGSGCECYNQFLDYSLYSLGQGPSIDELNASGSCWLCTKPPAVADPVNAVTGEFWQTADDISVPGRGIPLDFNRTYSSNRSAVDGPLGFGWTHAYAFGLTLDGSGNATVSQATGAKTFFNWNSTLGTFSTAPRTIATLVRNGNGSFTLTQKDKSQLQFDATGRLTAEVDKDSYATNLAYDGAGHLQTVTDAAGRALTFTYEGTHIKQIQDVAGRVVVFTYVSTDLVSVADVGGGLAQYTYNAQQQLTNLRMRSARPQVVPEPPIPMLATKSPRRAIRLGG